MLKFLSDFKGRMITSQRNRSRAVFHGICFVQTKDIMTLSKEEAFKAWMDVKCSEVSLYQITRQK